MAKAIEYTHPLELHTRQRADGTWECTAWSNGLNPHPTERRLSVTGVASDSLNAFLIMHAKLEKMDVLKDGVFLSLMHVPSATDFNELPDGAVTGACVLEMATYLASGGGSSPITHQDAYTDSVNAGFWRLYGDQQAEAVLPACAGAAE